MVLVKYSELKKIKYRDENEGRRFVEKRKDKSIG